MIQGIRDRRFVQRENADGENDSVWLATIPQHFQLAEAIFNSNSAAALAAVDEILEHGFSPVSYTHLIFGKEQKPRKKKKNYNGQRIQDFSELSIGDFVVHEKHGLGIYKGIEKVEVDRIVKDYIKIEYRGGSNLYILATQLDALQKYSGAEAARTPRLNKLGGQE